jgi:hypothetical protein
MNAFFFLLHISVSQHLSTVDWIFWLVIILFLQFTDIVWNKFKHFYLINNILVHFVMFWHAEHM